MPPKTRITEEKIVDAAIEVVRKGGFEQINARTVADQLDCSTQPVMYHFSTIDNLKKAVYQRADQLHSEYLMTPLPSRNRSCSAFCFSPGMFRKTASWKWWIQKNCSPSLEPCRRDQG